MQTKEENPKPEAKPAKSFGLNTAKRNAGFNAQNNMKQDLSTPSTGQSPNPKLPGEKRRFGYTASGSGTGFGGIGSRFGEEKKR